MDLSRRVVLRSLSASVLGAGGLSACSRRRGGGEETTAPPSGSEQKDPENPLVLASIGSAFHVRKEVETSIGLAIREAVIDVNDAGGVFGQDLTVVDRVVQEKPGQDLQEAIAAFQDQRVSVVISSLEDGELKAALPLFTEAQMLVVCPTSRSMTLRSEDMNDGGLMYRLEPTNRMLAAQYVAAALDEAGEGVTPGTIAIVSPDTDQGRDLREEIETIANPANAKIVFETFYPRGELGDVGALAAQIVAKKPSLLVLNGGVECGALAAAVYTETLDGEGRPTAVIGVRFGADASVDYAASKFPAKALAAAKGYLAGGDPAGDFQLKMDNVDHTLNLVGYPYAQHAYDAVLLAALAAAETRSTTATELATGIDRILAGSVECGTPEEEPEDGFPAGFGGCLEEIENQRAMGEDASIDYLPQMGDLELASSRDPITASVRYVTYDESNAWQVDAGTEMELAE